ncbi:MAG: methyltransferase [Bacteroidia bacterium]|nr:methyltransferase [Bacteroidia bacterium]
MSPNLNEEYWTKRYQDNDAGWDIGYVSPPLKKYFDQLTDKKIKILIPGAGNSYEAEYLVNNGFENVYVCDLSAEPLNNLLQRCPKIKKENLIHCDFFELNKQALGITFDLIVEQTFFCALNPALRKKYFQKMSELLNPGGHLIGLLFDDTLNTDKPPFGGNKAEYLDYIGEDFIIRCFERCYNSIIPRQGRELFMNLQKSV